jgi:DNA recombination protein RmuC
MIEVLIALVSVLIILVMFALFLLIKNANKDTTAPIQELRKQIDEMKDKQSEMQNNFLTNQQNIFINQQSLISQNQQELREQLMAVQRLVQENLSSTQGQITSRLQESNQVILQIQEKLGVLEITTKNIQDISKDISSLQDILRAPKLRGNIGEYLLEKLLQDVLPKDKYEMQYRFKNGIIVDAVIKLGDRLVPIDSKFPLESFQRLLVAKDELEKKNAQSEFVKSLKEKIDSIASKYIKPEENTYEFALMYIPAENIYYEFVVSSAKTEEKLANIFNYAIEKRVIPVSPGSFYAYLLAIVFGLKGMSIEKRAQEILKEISKIQVDFDKFYEEYKKVGSHLTNAKSKYEETERKAEKFQESVKNLIGNKAGDEQQIKYIQ